MSNENLISITQYRHPDGKPRIVQAPVSPEHKAWVDEHQPVLSAEVLPGTSQVAIYGRLREWPEEEEI